MIQMLHEHTYPVVQPHGPMLYADQEQLKLILRTMLGDGERAIIVDLRYTDLITSAGLGILFTLQKELQAEGGRMALVGPKPSVLTALRDWRLDQILSIYATMKEACDALGSTSS
ncbi:MAG: STAS domain-containing protein [bacterium]|nr:STAS domain-containing protein [bacterium]